MPVDDLAALVEPVQRIARAAGHEILTIYRRGFSVSEKADRTPLTEADLAAHDCIVAGLRELTPEIPVLSEEDQDTGLERRSAWDRLWLVDPLDGTREFIRRSDQFSINLALVHEHQAVFGLIHIPCQDLSYFAWRGGGAFKRGADGVTRRIHTRPVGERAVQVAGGGRLTGRPLQTYLEYIGRHQYRTVGSSLKSCLVAEGRIDLYPRFGPTSEWDTAAAQIIVEEAGGGLTDMFMCPLRYNARPTLINPDFFVFGDPGRDWSQYLPRRKPGFSTSA